MRRLVFAGLLLAQAGCGLPPRTGVEVRQLPRPQEAPAIGADQQAPDPDETMAHHLAALDTTPSSPLTSGEAQLLVDGPKTHQAMFAAMERARDHINLETYILEDGEIGEARSIRRARISTA